MSYYQFQGPVQAAFGPLDDEMRRRRKHHRDAGAPFSGGITMPPKGPERFEKMPDFDVQITDAPRAPPDQPDHAPRMAAAGRARYNNRTAWGIKSSSQRHTSTTHLLLRPLW